MQVMIIAVEYQRPRREFGQRPKFSDAPARLLNLEWSDKSTRAPDQKAASNLQSQWVERAVTTVEVDCVPSLSEHQVSTEAFTTASRGAAHTEGMSDSKADAAERVKARSRKLKNEPGWQAAVINLCKSAEFVLDQNNTLDLMEEYFSGPQETFSFAPPSCRTVCVLKDPVSGGDGARRAATKVSWHPEPGSRRLAVAYSVLQFQQTASNVATQAYIWDISKPNEHEVELTSSSPLTCLVYNPRSPDHLVGGCHNGCIAVWDLRKGTAPAQASLMESTHKDPVYDVFWVQSRTGNECVSVSTDGQLMWWDTRNLAGGAVDTMELGPKNYADGVLRDVRGDAKAAAAAGAQPPAPTPEAKDFLYCGTCLEYRSDSGATRYLVGTEQGTVLLCDRKPQKDAESQKVVKTVYGARSGKHLGPIHTVQRNPVHNKYFLTVGDWTAKVWQEDLKTPILSTRYDPVYLTGGCWSPTRPGVFFTTKMDGSMDAWDLTHKQSEPVFSTKIGDLPICSIRIHPHGKLVALGSQDGTVTVIELSDALSEPHKNEKQLLGQIFERETLRERNLEQRALQRKAQLREKRRSARERAVMAAGALQDGTPDTEALLKEVEKEFYKVIDPNPEAAVKAEAETPAAKPEAEAEAGAAAQADEDKAASFEPATQNGTAAAS